MIITDDHINDIEKILLPEGCSFDDERRKFIKCIDSRDVSACAGSGKTTALIAKLMILDKYFLPLPQNKGICVLTHTNVAINEVRERLGSSSKLLQYPNFFGTIQSFVNKYLAVPMYIEDIRKRPTSIDSDLYNTTIEKAGNFLISSSNTKYCLSAKGWLSNQKEPINLLKQIRFSLKNETLENLQLLKSFNGDNLFKKKETAYNDFYNIKYETLFKKRGLLHFDDAYTLANLYIDKYEKELQKLFANRFQFVFIDEMQDSYQHQIDIFDKIFDKVKITYQCIGDPNQAIYNSVNNTQIWQPQNPLYISESRRFSTKIANAIHNVRLDIKAPLKGNSDRKIIKRDGTQEEIYPYIILFDDNQIKNVITKFKDLIVDNKLHFPETTNQDNKKIIFKAIGWVGQDKDETNKAGQFKHYIKHYFDDNLYKKESKTITTFDNLSDYLLKQNTLDENGKKHYQSTKPYTDALVNALLNVLQIVGKKQEGDSLRNYTTSTFWKKVNSDKKFKKALEKKIFSWCYQIIQGCNIKDNIEDYIKTGLKDFFEYDMKPELTTFFNNPSKLTNTSADKKIKNQIEFKDNKGLTFKIDIATIHSVKGETHTGTLYLETFKDKFETKKGEFKNCLKKCEKNRGEFGVQLQETLKMAYVGMSRPTHLLCVALHKSGFDNLIQDIKDFESVGWKVIQL
jgi:superfamily I DNA/RNA helicase